MKVPAASSVLAMRRRSVWEAADSGILLWRNNFFYFFPVFVLPFLIAALCLPLFVTARLRWVCPLALWWLKPLFDRLCLQVVSSRFFKSASGDAETDSEKSPLGFRGVLRGFFRNFFSFLLGDLLWRRFSPLRSAVMPLRILEKPNRKQYAERKNTLASGGLNFCAVLSCLGLLFEAFLLGGELVFSAAMTEIFLPFVSWNLRTNSSGIFILVYCAYCFNYILVESLYVCMGFGLYINSRTEVEGWDIELLFRKFSGKAAKTALAFFIIIGAFVFTPTLNAADSTSGESAVSEAAGKSENYSFPPGFTPPESVPLKNLEEILSSEDFGGTKPGWTVRLKNNNEYDENTPEINFAPWLAKVKEILARALRIVIILAAAGFIVFIFMKLRGAALPGRGRTERGVSTHANTLNKNENPEACFEKAEEYFHLFLLREAWAACLLGTIAAFNVYFGVSFPPDTTEYGCLDLVRSHLTPKDTAVGHDSNTNTKIIEGFRALIRSWVLFAYGGRNPPGGSFEAALEFGRSLKNTAAVSSREYQGAARA